MIGGGCLLVAIFAQSLLDKEDLNADIFFWKSLTCCLLPPCVLLLELDHEAPNITGSGPRGPWLAGRRRSSWRRLATLPCWACRRWGCRQLRIPRPANVSSQSPRAGGDTQTHTSASNLMIRDENTDEEAFSKIFGEM